MPEERKPARLSEHFQTNLAEARLEAARAQAGHLNDTELEGIALVAWLPEIASGWLRDQRSKTESKSTNRESDILFRESNILIGAFWDAYFRDPEAVVRLLSRLRKRILRKPLETTDIDATKAALAELPDGTREAQILRAAEILGIKEPRPLIPAKTGAEAEAQRRAHAGETRTYERRIAALKTRLKAFLRTGQGKPIKNETGEKSGRIFLPLT